MPHLDGVSEVMYQGIPFKYIPFDIPVIKIAHGQLRFKLNRPVVLRAQSGDKTVRDSVSDIIISSTITKPKDEKYSIVGGSSFGIVTRVLSTVARAVEEVADDRDNVHQYLLDLSSEQMNRLLAISLEEASVFGYSSRYDLLKNNCATKTMDAYDAAFPRAKNVKRFEGKLSQFRDVIEKPALEQFKLRGINYERVDDLNSQVVCAVPGEKLGKIIVDKSMIGAGVGLCKLKSEL